MKRPILLFCFILFFLCSCQSKKGDSLFLPLSELKPLTLGMMPTLEGLPFYIARSEGIYDSLGLDLTILPFNFLPTTVTPFSKPDKWMVW